MVGGRQVQVSLTYSPAQRVLFLNAQSFDAIAEYRTRKMVFLSIISIIKRQSKPLITIQFASIRIRSAQRSMVILWALSGQPHQFQELPRQLILSTNEPTLR